MTFLFLPYILASYLTSFSSALPVALHNEAAHFVAYADSSSQTDNTLTLPVDLPDLTAAFLAFTSDEKASLDQDIQDLPLNPLPVDVATEPTVAPSPVEAPSVPSFGISVLAPLPSETPHAIAKPVSPSSQPTPLVLPTVKPVSVPMPTASASTLYIPPRPSPVPTANYIPSSLPTTPYVPPVVAPPPVPSVRPVVTPTYVPTPTAIPATSTPVPAVPANRGATASGLQGPMLKAVQSDNLPTYYLTIPRLGLSNVPVNPTDATNDEIWKSTLIKGVGQLLYPPDSGHKTVIFGHSSNYKYVKSNYNEVFKNLPQMKVGDTVSIDYNGKHLNYLVKKFEIVPATTPSIVTDYRREELVLFTCWPYLTSKERYIIYLDRVV